MALNSLATFVAAITVALLVAAALPQLSNAEVYGYRMEYHDAAVEVADVDYTGDGSDPRSDTTSYPQTSDENNEWTIFGEPYTGKECYHVDGTPMDASLQFLMWVNNGQNYYCKNWGTSHGFYRATPVTSGLWIDIKFANVASDYDVWLVDSAGNDVVQCARELVEVYSTQIIFYLDGCDFSATAPSADYDYSTCATGTHGIDCSCTADSTPGDAALVTSLTFSHATDLLTVTASGALDQTQRAVTDVSLGNSAGDTCYQVPYASWSCDATTCDCSAAVAIADYIAACPPTEASLDDDRVGFTVYATAAGEDTRDTDNFGQPIDPAEVTTLSATSSTTVTTQQTVVQAVGVDQGLTSLTVDTITIIPRSANSGDTDAELEVVLTMVTPADYNVMGTTTVSHDAADVDTTSPAWSTTCGDTCSHTITFLLATGDLTADPAAACDFSGITTITNTMDTTAACYAAGTCTAAFDITVDVVELHSAEVCNPNDDNPDLASSVEAPTGGTNPDTIVTTPGSTYTASWESTVELSGDEHDSTLSSIVAALLPAGESCTTDLVSNAAAFEVFDNTQSDYADISGIFAVAENGLGELITLTLDSSDATAQTLYGIATDQADFRSSFAGVFCFVVTRDVTLVSTRRRLSLRRVAATGVETSARSSGNMPLQLTGVDASVLVAVQAQANNAPGAAGAAPVAPATGGTVVIIVVVVAVAVVALVAIAAFIVLKARRSASKSAVAVKTLQVVGAPARGKVVELEAGSAWAEQAQQ